MSSVAGDDRRVPGTTPDPKRFEVSGKIMLTAIIILFFVVVFMASLHLYFRWYFLRQRRRQTLLRRRRREANGSRAAAAAHIVFYVDGNNPHALVDPANTGLDAAVLRSLPKFVFSSKTSPEGLECAVCLSEFEENESGRVLPKCSHSFHTECIDMWFHSHSTCPICRAGVEPVLEPENTVETLPDSVSDLCSGWQHAGTGEGSSMPPPLASRRKGLDIASVRIDVPMRGAELDTELTLSSPASYGFRSPGTRLLTLKRILSMGRKTPTASPSSTAGPSCSAGAAELDLESGRNYTESTRAPTPR